MTTKPNFVAGALKLLVLCGALVLLPAWRLGPPLSFFEQDSLD